MAKNTKSKSLAPAQLEPAKTTQGAPLFVTRAQIQATGTVTVKSMSPILKPINWPKIEGQNAIIIGVLTKIVPLSEFEEGKGKDKQVRQGWGAEIVPAGAPVGVVLPLTATLKTGLDCQVSGTQTKEDLKVVCPTVGKTIEVELLPERIKSKKGQAAWHFIVAIHDSPPTLALK